jgi:hypothetical protein
MRNLLALSAAVSVLALGITTHQAAALLPGTNATSPGGVVHQVQKSDEKGSGTSGQESSGKAANPSNRDTSGKGPSASDGKGRDRSAAQDKGNRNGQMRSSERQTRSNDKGERSGQRRTNVDVNVNNGRRGYRADTRTRVGVDASRGHRSRGRDVDVNVRGGYGYSSGSCEEILRRYRQCRAR